MNKKILLWTIWTLVLTGGVWLEVSQYQTNNEAKFDTQSCVWAEIKPSGDVDAIWMGTPCQNTCKATLDKCLLAAGSVYGDTESVKRDTNACSRAYNLCMQWCLMDSTSDKENNSWK